MIRETVSYEWFTIFLVVGLVFITLAKTMFENRFLDFIKVLGNSKYLKIYTKDQKFIDLFDSLLFSNLVLGISILGYFVYLKSEPTTTFELIVFFKIILGVSAIFLIKTLLERLIGSLFEIDKIMEAYIFQKTSYKNYIGIILLPLNALLIYTLDVSQPVIIGIVLFLFLINMIGFFTTFKIYQKTLLNNIFYFILYLCALEIGPYLILYKLIVENKA